MKLIKLFFLIMAFIGLPTIVMAQTGDFTLPGLNLNQVFVSFGAMVPVVLFLSSWIKKIGNITGGWARVISWLVSICLAFVGRALNLGMFVDIQIWAVVVYGLCVGLAANGVFTIDFIKDGLRALNMDPKKKISKRK